MMNHITISENEGLVANNPKERMEHMLMETFLAAKGLSLAGLDALTPQERKHWLTQASQFASLHLAEIETSAHLWTELKGKGTVHADPHFVTSS